MIKLISFHTSTVLLILFNVVSGLNILLTSEDSWVSSNIRFAYQQLKDVGHNVILVAPARSSVQTKDFIIPSLKYMEHEGEFGSLTIGDLTINHDIDDENILYTDTSVVGSVLISLDYLIPEIFKNITIDLVVVGPKSGATVGQFSQIISPTVHATKTAVIRGFPAIAISTASREDYYYKDASTSSDDFRKFPPNIHSLKLIELIEAISSLRKSEDDPLLPKDIGLNVNIPLVGDSSRANCMDPKFIITRSKGGYSVDPHIFYNEDKSKFYTEETFSIELNECIGISEDILNSDSKQYSYCKYPSEISIVDECSISITKLNINSDSSSNFEFSNIRNELEERFITYEKLKNEVTRNYNIDTNHLNDKIKLVNQWE